MSQSTVDWNSKRRTKYSHESRNQTFQTRSTWRTVLSFWSTCSVGASWRVFMSTSATSHSGRCLQRNSLVIPELP